MSQTVTRHGQQKACVHEDPDTKKIGKQESGKGSHVSTYNQYISTYPYTKS